MSKRMRHLPHVVDVFSVPDGPTLFRYEGQPIAA